MGHWERTGRKEVLKAPTEEAGRTGEKRWVWPRQLVKPNEQVWEVGACLEAFRGHWAAAEACSESDPPRKQDFTRLGFGSSHSFLPGLSPKAWEKGKSGDAVHRLSPWQTCVNVTSLPAETKRCGAKAHKEIVQAVVLRP